MSFLTGAGKSQASQQSAVSGLQLQSSSYGKAVPIIYGTTLVAPNLIWYGDFIATPQQSSSGAGGKGGVGGGGGGKGGGGSTSYIYQTAVALGLGEGVVQGVGNVYVDKNITTIGALGLSLFQGAYGQAPWGYLSSNHPYQALGYSGFAYLATGAYALGNSAQLPNHNMEVVGIFSGSVAQEIIGEEHVIPSNGPGIITVTFAADWVEDLGVTDSDGNPYTLVEGALGSQQYSVIGQGIYGFNDVNGGTTVIISYLSSVAADADPSLVVADLLSNPHYGAGFPAERIGDLSVYQSYCIATGLLISPAYTDQAQASSMLDDIAMATNSAFVWSSGVLTLVPYGDTVQSSNGYSYTPPSSPLYDLSDDDFLPNTNATGSSSAATTDDPILLSRKRPSDNLNSIKIECLDRSNGYNPAVVEAKDQALIETFGLRQSTPSQMHMFANLSAGRLSAQLQLQRQSICNTYQFTLDQRFVLLDPMDIVTITDANLGLNKQWVRITEITENDDSSLLFAAEEYLAGTGSAPVYSFQLGQGFAANYNTSPGDANAPVIFEPTAELAEGLEVWMAASGGPLWGGCDVYLSNDGSSYKNIGRINGSARTGVLSAPLPAVRLAPAGQTIDTIDTLAVNLSQSNAQLLSGSLADATSLATLCYVDGEFIAYQNATLTGANEYNLTTLVRAAYGSTPAAHASGAQFARIDGGIFKFSYTQDFIGSTVYIKLVSFNIYSGGQQSLASVPAYAYAITGLAFSSPLPDVENLRTSYVASITQLAWDEVQDFRTLLYEIRRGAAWEGAQVLGRVAHPPFNVQGDGTYWVSAYSQPTAGLQVYSENPQDIVISGAQIVSNVIATYDEASTGWSGTLSGTAVVADSNVVLSGVGNILVDPDYLNTADIFYYGGIGNGIYEIPSAHHINIGRVAPCSVLITWSSAGQNIADNILTVPDYLNFADVLDYASSALTDIYPEIALSQDGSTWSAWQKYSAGSYNAMAFKARMQLQTTSAAVEAVLEDFVFAVDVPDRDDHYVGLSLPSGGLTLTFTPDGSATAVAFNGGPQGSPTAPLVQVSILNAQAGDIASITSVSLSGCRLQILNGGSGVARNVNVLVQGY